MMAICGTSCRTREGWVSFSPFQSLVIVDHRNSKGYIHLDLDFNKTHPYSSLIYCAVLVQNLSMTSCTSWPAVGIYIGVAPSFLQKWQDPIDPEENRVQRKLIPNYSFFI